MTVVAILILLEVLVVSSADVCLCQFYVRRGKHTPGSSSYSSRASAWRLMYLLLAECLDRP